jgi:hypothetical protein
MLALLKSILLLGLLYLLGMVDVLARRGITDPSVLLLDNAESSATLLLL